jgi:heptosyltransferase II
MTHYQNILVRGVNRLGDTLFSLPAIKALKKKYPEAKLTVLTKPMPVELYRHNPFIDKIIIFDSNGDHRGLPGRLRLIKTLRTSRFDIAVLMHNNFESALTAFLSGIPERIGYQKEFRSALLTRSLPLPQNSTPRTDHFLAITNLAGCETKDNKPDLYLSEAEREWAVTRLGNLARPIVGIIPGAQEKTRIWDGGRFATVADSLINKIKANVLILGGPGDNKLSSSIISQMDNIPIDMTGAFNLREFIAILNSCDLVISNDTGPMHIASLLGTEVITFFGAGDIIETCPLGEKVHVIHKYLPCSPCLKSECPKGNYKCLDLITAEEVIEIALQALKPSQTTLSRRSMAGEQVNSR